MAACAWSGRPAIEFISADARIDRYVENYRRRVRERGAGLEPTHTDKGVAEVGDRTMLPRRSGKSARIHLARQRRASG